MILLLAMAVPVAAESSTITSISPTTALTGTTTTVTITGENFNTSLVKVRLMMSGESNISATVTSHSSTSITCQLAVSSSAQIGTWDVVVVNEDLSEVADEGAFTIGQTMTLVSVSPASAQTNNDSVDVTVAGTGLSNIDTTSGLYLYNKNYDNLTASGIDVVSSTEVTGTFDLAAWAVTNYEVCVMDTIGTRKCGLSFDVTTDKVGELDISSSPSGALVYVDSEYVGTTPYIMENVVAGSHVVKISETGDITYSGIAKVTDGGTTSVDADLALVPTTVVTTVPTTVPTLVPTTAGTLMAAKTVKIPTPWPTGTTIKTTTAKASPLDGLVGIGAIGFGIVVLRRKQ